MKFRLQHLGQYLTISHKLHTERPVARIEDFSPMCHMCIVEQVIADVVEEVAHEGEDPSESPVPTFESGAPTPKPT